EIDPPVVPLGEADEHERRQRACELERDDAVDLALAQRDPAERQEADKERERGRLEGVQAGSAERRPRTRSCSRTVPRSVSVSIRYAFGLSPASQIVHARYARPRGVVLAPAAKRRVTNTPRRNRRRAHITRPKSTRTISSAAGAARSGSSG